jgi:hypothetical protein
MKALVGRAAGRAAATIGPHHPCAPGANRRRNQSGTTMLSFLREFGMFLRTRKRFWLVPILVMMAIFGGLIVLTQGTAVAPFIYTLF